MTVSLATVVPIATYSGIGARTGTSDAGLDAASSRVQRETRENPAPNDSGAIARFEGGACAFRGRGQCTWPTPWHAGDLLDGRYVLRAEIAGGGMGSVFAADQPSLGRRVAIKLLHPALAGIPGLAHRMREEAALASRVRDPHCITVFDTGLLGCGTPYIVMDYIHGPTIGRMLTEAPIPLVRAISLFEQVLRALTAVHRVGIIHGDIKSDNFLVEQRNGFDHVVLIDFGLARGFDVTWQPERRAGRILVSGTPGYMAPEVIGGAPPRPASDMYGAGVILYELLTGRLPFHGRSDAEILRRHSHDQVVPPSRCTPDRDIPPALDRVVIRALHKRHDARFPDAARFARAVRAAACPRDRTDRPPRARATDLASHHAGADSPGDRGRAVAPGGHHIAVLHRRIGRALRRGDVEAIASGYLVLAAALVRARRCADAADELREGIDVLTVGASSGDLAARAVDRLAIALAALYEGAGERRLARRAATRTDGSPTRTYQVERPPTR